MSMPLVSVPLTSKRPSLQAKGVDCAWPRHVQHPSPAVQRLESKPRCARNHHERRWRRCVLRWGRCEEHYGSPACKATEERLTLNLLVLQAKGIECAKPGNVRNPAPAVLRLGSEPRRACNHPEGRRRQGLLRWGRCEGHGAATAGRAAGEGHQVSFPALQCIQAALHTA